VTSFYCAPELLKEYFNGNGDYKYCERTDVYSFGITLFEIVFERFPFGEKYLTNEMLFINNVVEKKLKPKLTDDEKLFLKNNEIENKVYNLCVVECLSDDPNKRPTFIQIKNILNQIKRIILFF
jgi:serine/threonine protein kinase